MMDGDGGELVTAQVHDRSRSEFRKSRGVTRSTCEKTHVINPLDKRVGARLLEHNEEFIFIFYGGNGVAKTNVTYSKPKPAGPFTTLRPFNAAVTSRFVFYCVIISSFMKLKRHLTALIGRIISHALFIQRIIQIGWIRKIRITVRNNLGDTFILSACVNF